MLMRPTLTRCGVLAGHQHDAGLDLVGDLRRPMRHGR
jgi:hypothetical protein